MTRHMGAGRVPSKRISVMFKKKGEREREVLRVKITPGTLKWAPGGLGGEGEREDEIKQIKI